MRWPRGQAPGAAEQAFDPIVVVVVRAETVVVVALAAAAQAGQDRQRVDRRQAFEMLRARARAERRKIGEVAEELLLSLEKLNSWAEVRPGNGGTPRKL